MTLKIGSYLRWNDKICIALSTTTLYTSFIMKTELTYSIETVKIANDFSYADVLIVEETRTTNEAFPLHIVFHPSGELDFYKGNKTTFAYDCMDFSNEVWDLIYEWISNNVPALED